MYKRVLFFLVTTFFVSSLQAKIFTVSYDPDYAPFSFSQDEKAYGLFVDIWKLWAKNNHHTLKFVKADNWDDALHMVQTDKVDFFLGTTPYEKWMKASKAYYKTKTALFVKKIIDKHKIHAIAIIGDDYKDELQSKFKDIDIISYDTYHELLNALLDNKVDAIYDDSLALSYFSIEHKYTHIIKKISYFSTTSDICAISSQEEKIKIFDKGMEKLSTDELLKVEQNWIFTKNERFYEEKESSLELKYVYDPDWKPFEYQDKMSKVHTGIIADILSLISSKTSIKFIPVASASWAEAIQTVKQHKAQMFSAVPMTKEREEYLNFTKNSIYSYPAVLIARDETPIELEKNLNGKSIGVIKENSLGKWIEKQNPLALFTEFTSVESALEALENGSIDFFAINGVTALYYINVLEYSDFKIYSMMDYMFHLKIAFLKDVSPEIVDMIDKSLSQITQKELSDIYHKWTSVQVKKELNWELLIYIVMAFIFIVLFSLFINNRLKKLVEEKTYELRELNDNLEEKVKERTQELAKINKDIKSNIEYASLIQNAILPLKKDIDSFFTNSFVFWSPKDIVGGDIYFFEKINENEAFLIVIDCTGHGVSGAFVTMLTKAIEEQLLVEIKTKTYTPSQVLNYFNKTFKNLLHEESNSSVGFDAGVVYINKRTKLLKYSGAKTPLFYLDNDSVEQLKADKQSVGYDHCKVDYEYKEHSLRLQEGMKFYLTSDGYIDQNGGEKGFPLGKKRFQEFIRRNKKCKLKKQKTLFIEQLKEYQGDEERSDDIVFIGFEI